MENKLTLYEINDEIIALENALWESLDEETGEINQDIVKKLNKMQIIKGNKLNSICIVNEKIEDNVKLAKEKLKQIKDYIDKQEKVQQVLLDYTTRNIEVGKKYDLGLHKIGWRKSTATEIKDEDKFCEKYKDTKFVKTEISYKPVKDEIKEALQNGEKLEGVELVEKQNIQVK